MYEINYTDGRTAECETIDEAIATLEVEYPDLAYGHAGDLYEGGERTLCWECEADSLNDDGAHAVAAIYRA